MRTIYTTEKGLPDVPNVEFKSISCLDIAESIRQRQRELILKATLPERVAAGMLARLNPTRQAYFRIRKRSYYLDFFLKDKMLAIEIDGSSHKERKATDRRRDADFRSIGIRTVRIKNKDVMSGKLYDKLFKSFYKP